MTKFADDTTLTGLISDNDESTYRVQVESLIHWCNENNLLLNVSKTKEMIFDFRRKKPDMQPLRIGGDIVEQVSSFRFLGTHITDNITWSVNCTEILKKARQRLYFMRKLRSYGFNQCILTNFYRAIVESILTSSIIVWFGRATQDDIRRLSVVVRSAEKIIGVDLPSLESLYIDRSLRRTQLILSDSDHPANAYFSFLPSHRRLRTFRGNRRFTASFFPSAVKLYNNL